MGTTQRAARAVVAAVVVAVVVAASLLGLGNGAEAQRARAGLDFPDTDALLGSCLQLTPHTVSVTDERVRLDVRVLLDGVSLAHGRAAVADLRRAYGPLGIAVAPTFAPVRFRGTSASGLLDQARRTYAGRRPRGVNVVYVLTAKDIVEPSATGGQLAGLADCIGGIRYPSRAFAVGELGSVSAPGVARGTGKTMAHEIGHLLGAQHHYAGPEGVLAGDVTTPLSLMGPTIDTIALRFSTLEALMVRGHAQRYAR